LGSSGQRADDKKSEESAMMEDLEKTKPVDEAPADDDETGAGCDVCMPPIALVGADEYDYKYLSVWKSTSASGAPDNFSRSRCSAMTLPRWFRRAVRNRHRHAIEQASRRWRGNRRGYSGRTRQ
jgi:hypothetical protein